MFGLLTLVVSDAWRGEWSCARYGMLREVLPGATGSPRISTALRVL
jgi:hypothetical protein